MLWLTFLCVSYSCLSFWLSFSLLQKYPGVFLFWLSLLSMVLVFCSCSWLVWFSEAFSVVAFCEKNTSPLHILHRVFPLLYFPRSIKTTLQKMSSCTILPKCVWDNIAQENYLYNVDPERTDIALQKSNLGNVVLNLPGPTLYKAIACAMLSRSLQSSHFWLNMSGTTLYRTNYLYNVGPELIVITGSNL